MNHTTEKRITCLDQLNENDTIRLVHNSTGTKIEYDISKIDRNNKRITLTHESTTSGPGGQRLIENNTLTIGADKDDYIFSDNITIWLVSRKNNVSQKSSNACDDDVSTAHHAPETPCNSSEVESAINPFTGELTKMPVLIIDEPAVLPADFEGKYRLELNDVWKMSLKNGVNDNASLYPIFYCGRVFGVTAIDDRRTVIVRVKLGSDYQVFQSSHTYPEGKPYDTNLAISACVIKLITAISYWTTITTSLALCKPDITSMFDGDTIPEILANIEDECKTIIKNSLTKCLNRKNVNVNNHDENDDDVSDEITSANNAPARDESDEALPRVKPWWWTDNKGLI